MKYINTFLLAFVFVSIMACEKEKGQLTHAKLYQIVGEHDRDIETGDRNAKMYFITSRANTYEEFAQTAILAAIDLHKQLKKLDLIQVILVPDKDLIATSISYAMASYAVDKKGAKGLSGADQITMTNFKWLVRAAEKPLNQQELEIAKLWYKHMADFPSEDMLSSKSYNEERLKTFIANTLNLNVENVQIPQIKSLEYKALDFLD